MHCCGFNNRSEPRRWRNLKKACPAAICLTRRTTPSPCSKPRKISKYFGAVTALQDVDLKLHPGEVLGVVGDNGAGKSTLMKVLSGLHPPSAGSLVFDGEPVHFTSPASARRRGIEMVYQDLALAGNMNIAENIYLGREPKRKMLGGLISLFDHKAGLRMAEEHLGNLKIHVKSVEQKVEEAFRRPAPGRGDSPARSRSRPAS